MAVTRRTRAAAAAAVLIVTLLGGCGGTDDTLADHPDPTWGPAISQDEAVRIAGQVTPGDLVEVRRDNDRGVLVFDVITQNADGILTSTQVAANTGEVLRHLRILRGHWVRLSDAEATSWGAVEVIGTGLAVFVLVRVTGPGSEAGPHPATREPSP